MFLHFSPTAAARDRVLSRDVRRRNVVALLQHALERYVAALDLSGRSQRRVGQRAETSGSLRAHAIASESDAPCR